MVVNTSQSFEIVSACDMKNGQLGIIVSDNGANGHYVLAITTQLMINLTSNTAWERRSSETFKVVVLPTNSKVVLEQR